MMETLLKERSKSLGYASISKYFLSMAMHDLIYRRDHHLTVPLANAAEVTQDTIIERLAQISHGKINRPTLLERCIASGLEREVSPEDLEALKKRIGDALYSELTRKP